MLTATWTFQIKFFFGFQNKNPNQRAAIKRNCKVHVSSEESGPGALTKLWASLGHQNPWKTVYILDIHVYIYIDTYVWFCMFAKGDQSSCVWKRTFRETWLSLSRYFRGILRGTFLYMFHDIEDHAYNSLLPGHGPRPMLDFFRCIYRGALAKFYAGFPKNGYLVDMCYVKLSRNRNFPLANIIAELSRNPKHTCNVRFYINPLHGPSDRCALF